MERDGVPTPCFGRFRILERIGAGVMGEVLLAEQVWEGGIRRKVALKVIRPEYSQDERFREVLFREVRILALLNHPNIVHIYDFGREEGCYYIVMEYVEGFGLDEVIRLCRRGEIEIPVPIVLQIGTAVCRALDHVHRRRHLDGRPARFIHRDIRPQNILLSLEGRVKLVDFGIAKDTTLSGTLMSDGAKGKLFYMAPEQVLDPEGVDRRVDFFGLGMTCYELLTGIRPYEGARDLVEVIGRVKEAQIAPLRSHRPDLPAALERILQKALAADREHRYRSAREMGRDLQFVLERIYRGGGEAGSLVKFVRRCHPLLERVTLPPERGSFPSGRARVTSDGTTEIGGGEEPPTVPAPSPPISPRHEGEGEPPTIPKPVPPSPPAGEGGVPGSEVTTNEIGSDPYFDREEEISTLRLRKKRNVPREMHTAPALVTLRKSTIPADRNPAVETSSPSLSTLSLSDLLRLSHDRLSTITGSMLFRLFLVLFLGLLLGVLLAVLWELWL
ncbi:MAG: serine/threonine protein kinase [Deltaproteobacteria bacterium]|nr:MAG: serine/threonine protein kinase [Deltaproteobacteria bacterium]